MSINNNILFLEEKLMKMIGKNTKKNMQPLKIAFPWLMGLKDPKYC
jgi:hypothetical protein